MKLLSLVFILPAIFCETENEDIKKAGLFGWPWNNPFSSSSSAAKLEAERAKAEAASAAAADVAARDAASREAAAAAARNASVSSYRRSYSMSGFGF